uniref:Uncharacterized protein n=1 Tax=Anopheles albimanus TaxID=7167 RepID=A0A182FXS8_ANOAL
MISSFFFFVFTPLFCPLSSGKEKEKQEQSSSVTRQRQRRDEEVTLSIRSNHTGVPKVCWCR